eukprot:1488958-Amphidinium_carterae.1
MPYAPDDSGGHGVPHNASCVNMDRIGGVGGVAEDLAENVQMRVLDHRQDACVELFVQVIQGGVDLHNAFGKLHPCWKL